MRGRIDVRASLLSFVVMTAIVAAASAGLLVLLDPRAQAFWGSRLSELGSTIRSLLPR